MASAFSSTFKEPSENTLTLNSTIHADENNLVNAESKVGEMIFDIKMEPLDIKEEIDNFDPGINEEIEKPEENEKTSSLENCFIDELKKKENLSDNDVMQDQEEVQFESNKNDVTSLHQYQLERPSRPTLKSKLQYRLSTCSRLNKLNFICNNCNKYVPSKLSLENHKLTHKSKGRLQCKECDKSFLTTKNITKHEWKKNMNKAFICENCNKNFSLETFLKSYEGVLEGIFKCKHCNQRFKHKTDLTKHLLLHRGQIIYKCDRCDKEFNNKRLRNKHSLSHEEEKSFDCDQCNKKFGKSSILKTHLLLYHRDFYLINLMAQ